MNQSMKKDTLECIAKCFRKIDKGKSKKKRKNLRLLFAYNGVGKTQLSVAFKNEGKRKNGTPDTLYFNAFTEDLFTWENDLENDNVFMLKMNKNSKFFDGLGGGGYDIQGKIRPYLKKYASFGFSIDFNPKPDEKNLYRGCLFDKNAHYIHFEREVQVKNENYDSNSNVLEHMDEYLNRKLDNIKISRGEERLFIWCFFLAIVELAMDKTIDLYDWVKYIYIDDPVSSLDENNAVQVACDLTDLIETFKYPKIENDGYVYSNAQDPNSASPKHPPRIIISTHHALFFNVLFSNSKGWKNRIAYFLSKEKHQYSLADTNDTPFFYHVAMLKKLQECRTSGKIEVYHFAILRSLLEKTASFHGYSKFENLIEATLSSNTSQYSTMYKRCVNLFTHGNHSLYNAQNMPEEYKKAFEETFDFFKETYHFNKDCFT